MIDSTPTETPEQVIERTQTLFELHRAEVARRAQLLDRMVAVRSRWYR